jgi:hypothetical protein
VRGAWRTVECWPEAAVGSGEPGFGAEKPLAALRGKRTGERTTPPHGIDTRHHSQQRGHHPPARLRGLPDPARSDQGRDSARARGRLPPHRHRRDVRQRGRRRGSRPYLRHRPGGDLRHQQAQQRGTRARRRSRSLRGDPQHPRHRLRRPVPGALAAAHGVGLRGDLEGDGGDLRQWQGTSRRSVQLPDHPPEPAGGRVHGGAGGEPDRGPSLPDQRDRAGLRRRARDRHRSLVAYRPGRCPRRPRHRHDRRAGRTHPGPGHPALARAAGRHHLPEVGDGVARQGELRPVRLRADRRRHRVHQRAEQGRADRTGSGRLRRGAVTLD